MEPHPLIAKADAVRAQQADLISSLADARMEEARQWFVSKFPGIRLKIIFGNGIESITLGNGSRRVSLASHGESALKYHIEVEPPNNEFERYTKAYYSLQPLADALSDVIDITNGYRDGCPNDLEIDTHD